MNRDEILDLLPQIIRRTAKPDNPLGVFATVMEEFHRPAEELLQTQDALFDPRRTRDEMIPFLAFWINVDWLVEEVSEQSLFQKQSTTAFGRVRELIANGAYLSRWRGTAPGMQMFLSIALGTEHIRVEEHSAQSKEESIPFHIVIYTKEEYRYMDSLINKIVRKEKPAYVTYEIRYE